MVRRARPIVRAATGITLSKRIVLNNIQMTDVSAADYDAPNIINLLECVEAQDEEQISNDSSVADCPLYSRVVSMKLNAYFRAPSATEIRWMLIKRPDGETNAATTSLIDATFHGSDDTQAARELRQYTLAKGQVAIASDRLQTPFRVFVSRRAWARASPMRENDVISLIVAKSSEGTTASISGFGTIYVKANA